MGGSDQGSETLTVACGVFKGLSRLDHLPRSGDVQFVGRGVAHEAKNTGGKPVDMVIVAIK